MPRKQGQFLYLNNDNLLSGHFTLPSWWQEKYSTPFSTFRTQAEVYRCVLELINYDLETEIICDYIAVRNGNIDPVIIDWLRLDAPQNLIQWPDKDLIEYIEKGNLRDAESF